MVRFDIRRVLLIAATLAVAACASPPTREAMTPTGLTVAKQHPFSLKVNAEAGPAGVSDADLKAAIEAAVMENRAFKAVVQGADGSDYELSVSFFSAEKPMFGASFTVTMEAAWSLTKVADRSVVMRKSVKSTGHATMGEAFAGAVRFRMALERAIRDNIAQGVSAIGDLKL